MPVKKTSRYQAKVKTILSELLQIDEDQITPAAKLQEDLGADSLDMVELSIILEEKFTIPEITGDDAVKLVTVQDVYDHLERHVVATV